MIALVVLSISFLGASADHRFFAITNEGKPLSLLKVKFEKFFFFFWFSLLPREEIH
jgi:hypothetical protein